MQLARRVICVLAASFILAGGLAPAAFASADGIDQKTKDLLIQAVRSKLGELTDSKNSDGERDKRAEYSQYFKTSEDGSYVGSIHINSANEFDMKTERYEVTLVPDGGGFTVSNVEVVDQLTGLYRTQGLTCYPFEGFKFKREGLSMTADAGGMCEWYFQGEVSRVVVMGENLKYGYEIPEHVGLLQQNHDFFSLKKILFKDHPEVFDFNPKYFDFSCDGASCEEILNESFVGLQRISPEERANASDEPGPGTYAPLAKEVSKVSREVRQARKENAFSGFQPAPLEGHERYRAIAYKDDDHGVGIRYNNWGGYEVEFFSFHRLMDRESPRGALFGYYTEETLKNTSFYDLETRDDEGSRWYDVYRLNADVEAGITNPEMISVKAELGLNIKHDIKLLPFFIATQPSAGGNEDYKRATLFMNSIRMNGEEVTWVKTSPFGGILVLPEMAKAGSQINLVMDFDSKAIRKFTPSYSELARFGWLPFVSFGDFVEEFELTVRTPAEYKVLGVGHQTEEKREGDVLVTKWSASSPVVFPSVIFGKYRTDDAGDVVAKKLDGTVIPVRVHVDEVSMMQLSRGRDAGAAMRSGARGIRAKQMRTIAQQAANSINLYAAISGLDYPYGELNIVNDPQLALYGQAPSSLIYLGSLVFRGEGELAGGGGMMGGGGGTGTAKFLKSVVAHEVGHQWWGSRVSNSNQRNYWFVETLAEYFSAIYLENVFGRKEYFEQVDEWRRNIMNNDIKTSVQAADSLWQGESGGARQSLIYNKGPYAFHVLRETFGDEKFFAFLKGFTQELAEKHLGGLDANGNSYNVDLEWFFDQWIRGVGLPQFSLDYTVRATEDGGYLIEGQVGQKIMIGDDTVEGKFYRGVVDLTVRGRKKEEEFKKRLTIDGSETVFRVKVPVKPIEVTLNENGGMLALDVAVNEE
jgi:hypothetical protein